MPELVAYADQTVITGDGQTGVEQDSRFIALWLHEKSTTTRKAYLADINKLYACCGKSLQEVTLEDVQHFMDSLAGMKPRSRARAIATVKSALSFGLKTGYLVVNVGAVVKLPKLEDTLAERILSEPQIARILALETHPRNHAILVLLYRGGLRVAEICDLQWRHLTERAEAGQVAVFGKGKKTRYIMLDSATWQEVMSLKSVEGDADGYVFASRQRHSRTGKNSRRLDESTVEGIVERAAKRAGISGKVSPHWMRHAHATHALENGAPITLVKETLGHKSIETTAKYTHVRPNASSTQYIKV